MLKISRKMCCFNYSPMRNDFSTASTFEDQEKASACPFSSCQHMGMGQNETTRGPLVFINFSICQCSNSFLRLPHFRQPQLYGPGGHVRTFCESLALGFSRDLKCRSLRARRFAGLWRWQAFGASASPSEASVCDEAQGESCHLAVAQETGTQNGTLLSGNMDQHLHNPSCLILSHSHLVK